ncbi:MAG: 50S ribosomal protein L13 [Anaerovoracaceae bacterium]
MSTFSATPKDITRKWYILDAEGKTLGRLATEAATLLRGKHKPIFTPSMDTGDYVIVINAEKIEVTGNKRKDKIYKHHSGYPGGLKQIPFWKMQEKHPEEIIIHAVKGMMPNGKLGRQMFKKLKVYVGPKHGHDAQKPEVREF